MSLTFEELAEPFAVGIHAKARLAADDRLERTQRSAILASISQDIRKLCDAVVPQVLPYEVSFMAWGLGMFSDVDLRRASWHHQKAFDPDRSQFHVEHVVPVNNLRQLCLEAADVEATMQVLRRIRVAWILKGENEMLNRAGYRTRRADPEAAYRELNITFMDPAEMDRTWALRHL